MKGTRRTFLRASGIALALPWLESLAPRRSLAQGLEPITRAVWWFIPNGVVEEHWNPAVPGMLSASELPQSLEPLAERGLLGDVNIISGLDNLPSTPDGIGDHAPGLAGVLTCSTANRDDNDVFLGTSADQVAAQALVGQAPRPSLELGMKSFPNCDSYPCAYSDSISWSDPRTPRGKRTDPHEAWLYLTGGVDLNDAEARAQAELRRRGEKSVLDFVLGQAQGIQPRLSQNDRIKLDQYLTSVRGLETQLSGALPMCSQPEDPGETSDFVQQTALMRQLQVFALSCDLTRVITFMLGDTTGPGPMPWVGVNEDYHNLTHHENDAGVMDQILACIRWEVDQIAQFIELLKQTPDGDTTLLYNTTLCVSSDVGRGARHNHDQLPVLMAGNGGGAFETGRYLHYEPEAPEARRLARTRDPASLTQALAMPNSNRLSNLHVSILNTLGVEGSVGDSTGPLPCI